MAYIDKINKIKEEVAQEKKKKVEQKRVVNSTQVLTEGEEAFAVKTIELMKNSSFNEVLNFINRYRMIIMKDPYKKLPLCSQDSFEYIVGFNDGFLKSLTFIVSEMERIWMAYLHNLEAEKEKNEVKN